MSAADLESLDAVEFGARLLARTPTHEGREHALLRRWAAAATEFGESLGEVPCRARVVESDGGLPLGLLARYTSRPRPTVELFTDTLARAEALIDANGWRDWFPQGSVRAAALAHEAVHEQLHHGPGRAGLRRALHHVVLRVGRRRLYGHVAGAEEIAAHAYARKVCGLGRSPLLLTEALAEVSLVPAAASPAVAKASPTLAAAAPSPAAPAATSPALAAASPGREN
ncbi:hypothetical protein ACIQM4_31675 [Streptomyces sp. NPDC091272]|uniref:hypothetical protein n=1 Tax=Streptomyces sp. NPDC091272 TaxID=3365981 RepID=UPI003814F548